MTSDEVSEHEIAFWRALMNAYRDGLHSRRVQLEEHELQFCLRFFLEALEEKNFRVVPVSPTREMLSASRGALATGKRLNERWVGEKAKHRLRLRAAIEAAPNWKRGMQTHFR